MVSAQNLLPVSRVVVFQAICPRFASMRIFFSHAGVRTHDKWFGIQQLYQLRKRPPRQLLLWVWAFALAINFENHSQIYFNWNFWISPPVKIRFCQIHNLFGIFFLIWIQLAETMRYWLFFLSFLFDPRTNDDPDAFPGPTAEPSPFDFFNCRSDLCDSHSNLCDSRSDIYDIRSYRDHCLSYHWNNNKPDDFSYFNTRCDSSQLHKTAIGCECYYLKKYLQIFSPFHAERISHGKWNLKFFWRCFFFKTRRVQTLDIFLIGEMDSTQKLHACNFPRYSLPPVLLLFSG